jgi:hypothetical protein
MNAHFWPLRIQIRSATFSSVHNRYILSYSIYGDTLFACVYHFLMCPGAAAGQRWTRMPFVLPHSAALASEWWVNNETRFCYLGVHYNVPSGQFTLYK